MEFKQIKKVKDGKYLKNYELTYLNRIGKEKVFEIVSRRELKSMEDVGAAPSGVSIVATHEEKMLLLYEFRMGVNKSIYNLCAGMIEEGESLEACIKRELYEETGLEVKELKAILPPSYAAVAISDVTTYIAFAEVTGEFADHSSNNEQIEAGFYTRDEVKELLKTQPFSSRAQMAAYFFAYYGF